MNNCSAVGGQGEGIPAVEGRVPPHDLDAEAAVLSAVMVDPAGARQGPRVPQARALLLRGAPAGSTRRASTLSAAGRPVDIVQVGDLAPRPRAARAGRRDGLPDRGPQRGARRGQRRRVRQDHPREVARPAAHPHLPARRPPQGYARLRRGAGVHRRRRAGGLRHRPHARVEQRLHAARRACATTFKQIRRRTRAASASPASRRASTATTA